MMNSVKLLFMFVVLLSAVACIGQPASGRKTSVSGSTSVPTPTPTFSSGSNYFQNGSSIVNSTLQLAVDFTDSFYIRGSQIHYFITTGNVGNAQCLVTYFPQSAGKRFLVTLANPRYLLNQSTGVKEYYYLVEPSNSTQNKNFCQKTGLINKLSTLDATATIAYSLAEICPTCSSSMNMTSNAISFYSPAGTAITDIQSSYLRINLIQGSITSGGTTSCSSSSYCQGIGYKCCSGNMCVNDGQTKPGIDTSSSEYKQALQDILSNPNNILKYPNYFYICAADPQATPTPAPTPNAQDTAQARLEHLRELYMCTTLLKGEMSICTATYKDASTSGARFVTGYDDRNFRSTQPSNSPLPNHSLYKVIHAGDTLYENQTFTTSPQGFFIGNSSNLYAGNDTLTDLVEIRLNHTKKTSAPNDDLSIAYKVDGSCKKVNNQLAQCTKYYTQGQNTGEVDDHYPGTDTFLIPTYADLSRSLKVEVDDVVKLIESEWTLLLGTPGAVTFIGDGQQVFDTQVVKITFYVSLTDYPNLMSAKEAALTEISSNCKCGTSACSLKPEYSGTTIINYTCVYPQPDTPNLPLQQTVMLSSKNVPMRFFDSSGVYHSTIDTSTPAQEGTKFEYTKSDLLKPNNINQYIGFNEIYGSMSVASGSAKPAIEVKVQQGKTYDLYADNGNFSTCYYCGNDYYNNSSRLFPSAVGGGGLNPDLYKNVTDKFQSTADSYRDDDFIFGRACFVPATMIPWTHRGITPRDEQRKARLAAQHFLFANGYQRDWYGFDYGSVIGSFDGVAWFSIGSQRRIYAKSNKLFLAVNAYYGDLTNDSTYRVTISDSTGVAGTGSTVTTDYDSDGAQCQKYHSCNTDKDCVTQLGWDYTCQSVSNIQTKWPVFDVNGLETPGHEKFLRLTQILGNTTGGAKRCVYRGRGTPCHQNYDDITDETLTYDGTTQLGTHGCSNNNYCQLVNEGLPATKFNNRISRYGKSTLSINSTYNVSYNTFGLSAKILGRPLNYNGTDTISGASNANLTHNRVGALCIPGRSTADENTRLVTASKATPSNEHMGDQVNGQGMTPTGQAAQTEYLSSCPVFDGLGNYLMFKDTFIVNKPTLGDKELVKYAGSQVIPSNAITFLQNSLDSSQAIMKNFFVEDGNINRAYLQENRCLRSPGSICHVDLDCAPSKFIADKMSLISSNSTNTGLPSQGINRYELQFWQENLVCGQAENKTTLDSQNRIIVNPKYDLKNNRCCRDTGKNLTIGTFTATSTYTSTTPYFSTNTVPGIDVDLNNKARYSRWSTVNYEMRDDSTSANFPELKIASGNDCQSGIASCKTIDSIYKQFNTFAQIADRTSCSGHWIRNFHSSIGGGHIWEASKAQNIPITALRCYNWLQCTPGTSCSTTSPVTDAVGFSCSHTTSPTDANCLIRSVPKETTHRIFEWFNTLEILGVPQATIASADFDDIRCEVNPMDQSQAGTTPAPDLVRFTAPGEYYGSSDNGDSVGRFYSGAKSSNFYADSGQLKMIFSPDTVSCCKPAGTVMPSGSDPNLCCTGYMDANNRCVLKDYVNVSVYFNRYISSAAKELTLSNFNGRTGFINDKSTVMRLACQQKVCASGYVGTGITYNKLKIPGHETNTNAFVYRFLDSSRDNQGGLVDLFKYGLRWNDDIYCINAELGKTPVEGMTVTACDP